MVAPLISALTMRQKQTDLFEFEVRQVYVESSRSAKKEHKLRGIHKRYKNIFMIFHYVNEDIISMQYL